MAITEEDRKRIDYYSRKKIPPYPYWYGMKKTLYQYADLPSWLPASVHLQHGANTIYRHGKPDHTVLNSRYPVIFLSNRTQAETCKKYLKKPIHVVGSVFPLFRKMHNIEQVENAKGTLAFPTHSSGEISVNMSWKQYAKDLLALPEKYHPITVSLYFIDLLKGHDKIFLEEGIDVVTSGHISDPMFVDRFYQHLQGFRYTTGNQVGSNLYYAVEMGIPFFIYGENPSYENTTNKTTPAGKFEVSAKFGYEKLVEVKQLFTFPDLEDISITKAQSDFVEESIGANIAIPPEQIRKIVWRSLPQFLIKMLLLLPILGPKHLLKRIKARLGGKA